MSYYSVFRAARRRAYVLAVSYAQVGCSQLAPPISVSEATPLSPLPRRRHEPQPVRPPEPSLRAATSRHVLHLEVPPGRTEMTALLKHYFAAIEDGSLSDLEELLTHNATLASAGTPKPARAFAALRRRLSDASLKASSVDTATIRYDTLEIYDAAQLARLAAYRMSHLKPGPKQWLLRLTVNTIDRRVQPAGAAFEALVERQDGRVKLRALYEPAR